MVVYVLDQYHQAGVTEPLLLEQLWEYGIYISAGPLHRLLTENQDSFHQEKVEALAVGLAESSFIGTDDTGARHQGKNGYCTVICNDLFAYLESTDNKSRLNFLQILQGTERDYAINETTLAYWNRQKLPATPHAQLTEGPQAFAGNAAWQARLADLKITEERHVRIATEGAGRLDRPRCLAHLGGAQRWRPAVRYPGACPLLGSRRTPASQTRALPRRAPRHPREHPHANLGTLPGPEDVSRAAQRGPEARSGSTLRHPGGPAHRLSQ